MNAPGPDDQSDALALIRASLEDDGEAMSILLDHADLRAVAEELAYRAGLLASMCFRGHESALYWIGEIQQQWAADEATP